MVGPGVLWATQPRAMSQEPYVATTFRISQASHNVRPWLSDAAGLQSRDVSDECELPLAQRTVASDFAPEVAAGA
jgi:hypothetical protein